MGRRRTPQESQADFSDIMSRLQSGSAAANVPDPEEPEDEDKVDGPDDSPEGDEPRDEPDNQDDTSDEPEGDGDQDEPSEDDQPEGESDDEGDVEDDSTDEDEAPTLELPSGEKVTGEQLLEKYTEFQRVFTQKRQEDSEAVKLARKEAQETRDLAREVLASEPLRELVNEFPDRLEMLLDNPDETRYLLANPSKVDKLRSEWEVLRDNPELAEKVARRTSEPDTDDDVDAELAVANARREAQAVIDDFKSAVATVADEFDGVDSDEVGRDMLRMVGITPETKDDEALVLDGIRRLFNWLYIRDPQSGQLYIQGNTIRDRFEVLKARAEADKPDEDDDVEEHNKKVDEQLERESKDRPPAVTKDDSPASPNEDVEEMKDFGDAMRRFMPAASRR